MSSPSIPLAAAPPRPGSRTLAVVLLALIGAPMSLTSVSVALPDIGRDLHAGAAAQTWAVTGYNVAFASLMLACGALADLVGRRRMFTVGTGLFAAGQLVAAAAPSILVLDAGRVVAGVGAAAALPAASALLAARFEGAERARAFGLFGATLGAGLALGPVLGGVIADTAGWRGILVLLAVIGAASCALSRVWLDESRDPDASRVDRAGTVTFTAGLAVLILAIVGAPDHGWLATRTIVLVVLGIALFVLFVVVERRQERPMLDLALLADRRFLGLCVAAMAIVVAFVPLLVNLPTLFTTLRGVDASTAGALLLFLTLPTLLVPVLAGSLKSRVDVRTLVWAGLTLEALGVAWLALAPPAGALGAVALPLVVAGTGVGIANGILDGAAVSVVPPARAGMAAGLFNTMRLGAETLAIAVAASLLVSWTSSGLGGRGGVPAGADTARLAGSVTQGDLDAVRGGASAGAPADRLVHATQGAYVDATHATLWVLVAIVVLALAATAVLLRTRRPSRSAGAERVSSEACSTSVA
ncbi:MFS transporter [Patulibacter minatonensis]|uniref:MFS transporter n=1 Tax=Patulibacter minatonensis TaxID=298163 RepID=UPI0004B92207|nr:MFS transporter [Patulibacter minatonensis]